jgi:D-sedoheptulose 7-phosphate isomerase
MEEGQYGKVLKKDQKFIKKYSEDFISLLQNSNDDLLHKKLLEVKNILLSKKREKRNVFIVGNGGSASIASHFSVDLTKNAKVNCSNFNEPNLITCFANDFGYEKWTSEAIKFYAKKNDCLILISCSGSSKNIINAAKTAKKIGIKPIITFTGNKKNNELRLCGDINFWVNSGAYNYIENIHQIWLLSLVDMIIGKSKYPPN